MPDTQHEVVYAFQPELAPAGGDTETHKFGAKDIFDLSWKNLLDAYTCTECGRCTAACPANITGKVLNPRKIMMDTRDRMEAVGRNIDKNKSFVDDGKTLLHDYIFEWGKQKDKCAMALGFIPIYNHSYKSNCEYFMDFEEDTILIKTAKAIKKGEELTINYNGDWNDGKAVWFEVSE